MPVAAGPKADAVSALTKADLGLLGVMGFSWNARSVHSLGYWAS